MPGSQQTEIYLLLNTRQAGVKGIFQEGRKVSTYLSTIVLRLVSRENESYNKVLAYNHQPEPGE